LCLAYSSIMWTYAQRTFMSISRWAWRKVSGRRDAGRSPGRRQAFTEPTY
jgi:hypothetical protein